MLPRRPRSAARCSSWDRGLPRRHDGAREGPYPGSDAGSDRATRPLRPGLDSAIGAVLMLKVLVVGSGGREHALAWKIARSPLVGAVHALPGNPGIGQVAKLVQIPVDDLDGIVSWAKSAAVDLVVVGPEGPLVAGLADRLEAAGVPVFGARAGAARIEGSK